MTVFKAREAKSIYNLVTGGEGLSTSRKIDFEFWNNENLFEGFKYEVLTHIVVFFLN